MVFVMVMVNVLVTAYNDFLARRAVFLLWDVVNNDSYVIRTMAWRNDTIISSDPAFCQ